MDVSHTSQNLSKMLLSCIAEWNLKRGDQMPSLTTDNAANSRLAGFYPHIRCVAHTLNIAIQRGLQVQLMERLLGRIRRVVTFFHKSTTAMAIFRNKQMILELPQHKLIQDVTTRWNSPYDMVSRFIEQNTAIEAILQSKGVKKNAKDVYTLSEEDITNAASVLGILEPMKTVTTLLCCEKSPTTSLIHPLKEMLLRQLKVKDDDSSLIKSVKAAITSNLEPRYTEPETLKFLLKSSFLDPRFKTMSYISDNETRDIFFSLSNKVKGVNTVNVKMEKEEERAPPPLSTLLKDNSLATSTDDGFPNSTFEEKNSTIVDLPADLSSDAIQKQPPIKKRKSAMSDLFGEVSITKVETAKSFEIRFKQELTGCKSEDSISLESNPPDWWKRKQTTYPLLSNLAKHYLCVPATSVASERVFSTAGDLVTAQRSCLSGEQVDKLIFLKKNYKYP